MNSSGLPSHKDAIVEGLHHVLSDLIAFAVPVEYDGGQLIGEHAHGLERAGFPVIAGEAVGIGGHAQRPDAKGGKTGGDRRFVPSMALAAKAFGATGYFFEVHPTPDQGLSDAANMLELDKLENLVKQIIA